MSTGFASVDGTDGFTRSGTPFSFNGLFRHRDQFGRFYFEITEADYDRFLEDMVDEDDNVSPVYFDEYWKVHMIKARFDKTVDIDAVQKKIDNRLIQVVKGQIYQMAEGSVIEDKPYKGSYMTVESVTQLAKQPKEIQQASAEYLVKKSAKDAADLREAKKPKKKTASKKKKTTSKKKNYSPKDKIRAKAAMLVDNEAEEGEDEDDEDDE